METISVAPAALAAHLRVAVARTSRRLRREAGSGLTPTHAAALGTIDRHGPLTPSDLAARERVARPTATKLVARLEAEGLVTRTADPADGRSCLIAISPAGRTLLKATRSRKDAFLARRLKTLTVEERETLARAASILERVLEEDRG